MPDSENPEIVETTGSTLIRLRRIEGQIRGLQRMVEEGLGIAMLPCVTIERELTLGILKQVDIQKMPPLARPIALIYRRGRKRPRTVQAFVDTLGSIYDFQPPGP